MPNNLQEVGVAPLAGGKAKDVRIVKVIVDTACCYREHKFTAEDPRSKCHLGLQKLDFATCPNCIWFGTRPPTTTKVLSGGEAMAVMGALQTLKETHDPMTGAGAEMSDPAPLGLGQPGAGG